MTELPNMSGKRVLVTGATNGIGEVTAIELAKLGAELTLVARSKEKADATLRKIIAQVPTANVEFLFGDLSVMKDVRRVAQEFKARHQRLDVLINNAGATFSRREVTAEGHEMTMALNHLGYFLLTKELLDVLKLSAPSRIVSVASEGHRMGKLDFEDFMSEKKYDGVRVYCASKLANVLFSNELAARLRGSGVTSNAVHPGAVNTGFGKNTPGWFSFVVKASSIFLLSPQKGARTTLHVATAPELREVTGLYFAKGRPKKPAKQARDEDAQRRLWELTERLLAKT